MVQINRREYPDCFEKFYIDEYCNLTIYPKVGILEKEAGLLSDFAEHLDTSILVYGDHPELTFFKDNLKNYKNNQKISYIHSDFKEIKLVKNCDVLLSNEYELFDKYYQKVVINGFTKILYLSKYGFEIFQKHFWYYFQTGYDNLICYTMIVKDAGPLLEKVLTDNLPIIDRWCILDTGSTDGTQDIIRKVLKDKKGTLYEEPFVDFKVSRNRCLELAGHTCKFICMLDDTYSIKGDLRSFLNEVRGDQFSDSFSLLIQSDDTEYYSNRIIKSSTNLRYIHRIHEVITDSSNINVTIPANKAIIFDNRSDYMETRTNNRKQFDLTLLFKEIEEFPDDPRALYYIAQTYGCIGDEVGKAEFFEKRIAHPSQGYIQEKIDACFELARCYNFKINPITKKTLTDNLSDTEWKICEKLYLQAYSLDPKRPDSLYFIGIHYYLSGSFEIAYNYFKKAFEIGYPIGSQYSLKPTLSFHFLPKFLTEMSYLFKDYQTGFKAAELFLTSSKFNSPTGDSWNLMNNWYKIHSNLMKLTLLTEPKSMNRPIFCFVTDGGWEPWTGKDILTKGLGGSETWIIEMAKHISRTDKYHVVVFCKCNGSEFYENVGYNPIELFHNFIGSTVVEYCVISRFTEYIPVALHGHAKNVGIIFHDLLSPEMIIPVHPKLKWMWGLTKWHQDHIKQIFPQFNVSFINYGINNTYTPLVEKIKNSFIYSSFPNRGLVVLLRMWPKIIKKFPDATLNIFCNLEQEWVNQVAPDQIKEIKKLLKINKTGITVHGWVSKVELATSWNKTEFWLYPCIFEETFCLTALEAAISKTKVITNGLAALSETAASGVIVPGNPMETEWQEECLKVLFKVMDSNNLSSIKENYNFAKGLTWKSQANKLLSQL